tara:strand:+ start:76 stop:306 length:231 start_codon:yes stop_codon:yes gene_type:complete
MIDESAIDDAIAVRLDNRPMIGDGLMIMRTLTEAVTNYSNWIFFGKSAADLVVQEMKVAGIMQAMLNSKGTDFYDD